jgi:hypothetical protein
MRGRRDRLLFLINENNPRKGIRCFWSQLKTADEHALYLVGFVFVQTN